MSGIANIIDGKAQAAQLRQKISQHIGTLKETHNIIPGLAVVLVGEDAASQVYVRNKEKASKEVGINGIVYNLPQATSQDEILKLVEKLNNDESIHGILVQLPLPKQIDTQTVVQSINPAKDVDGLHIENIGRLSAGMTGMIPCTPLGCLFLLKETIGRLSGKNAVILGRSNLVGKPMAQLLLTENCTVTIAHSRTENLAGVCKQADILVAAVGQPELVKGSWIKPGAVVIDVGINRDEQSGKLIGDVNIKEAMPVASAITPVPGGVGPMTIACLLANTFTASCRQNGLTVPELH